MRLGSIPRFLAAAVVLASMGCQPGVFTTEVKGDATIAGSPLGAVLNAFPAVGGFTNINFDNNQDFKNQGATKDQVRSVKVESIQLKIVSPSSQDFSFLDHLEFFADSGDAELEIAQKSNISQLGLQAPNPVLSMDVTNAELQPFVTAPSMTISTRGSGRQPPQDTHVQAVVRLRVELKLVP